MHRNVMRTGPPLTFRLAMSRDQEFRYFALCFSVFFCVLLVVVSQWTPELGFGENHLTVSPDNRRHLLVKALSLPAIPVMFLAVGLCGWHSIRRFVCLEATHLGIRLPRIFVSWDNHRARTVEPGPKRGRYGPRPIAITIDVSDPDDCAVKQNAAQWLLAKLNSLRSAFQVSVAGPDHSVEYIDTMLCRCRETVKPDR